jgi:hypothetical protein
MATIVNTPASSGSDSSGFGFLLGILLLFVFLLFFWYYGLPMLRSAQSPQSPQINVPDQVDVNVTAPQQPTTTQ